MSAGGDEVRLVLADLTGFGCLVQEGRIYSGGAETLGTVQLSSFGRMLLAVVT